MKSPAIKPPVWALTPILLPAIAFAYGGERVSQSIPAPAGTVVEVRNVTGTIDIRGHDAETVELDARLEGPREDLIVETKNGRILIRVEPKQKWGRNDVGKRAFLDIKVPRDRPLRVTAVSADVTVKETVGPLELETVSGDVDAQGSAAKVELATVSGDIQFKGDAPKIEGRTVSGNIRVAAESVTAELTAVSGDLEIKAGSLRNLELKTVSGDILVRGRFGTAGRFDLKTKSGDVRIVQPTNAQAKFAFRSLSGDLEGVPPVSRTSRRNAEAGRGNGPTVNIRTFSGDAEILEE